MEVLHPLAIPEEAIPQRWVLRYYDANWVELSDLAYVGATTQNTLSALFQGMMAHGAPKHPTCRTPSLREAQSVHLEVCYDD